jgi:hypothetical protein
LYPPIVEEKVIEVDPFAGIDQGYGTNQNRRSILVCLFSMFLL